MLIVESGSRSLVEEFLRKLQASHGNSVRVDLITCFGGVPRGFSEDVGKVYRVSDYRDSPARKRLFRKLRSNRYSGVVLLCTGEPIMTKWKWFVAAKVPSKICILNENGDYFWLDWSNWRIIRHFVAYRAGLSGTGAVVTPLRMLMFPLTLAYLLLFAIVVHLRRKVHA